MEAQYQPHEIEQRTQQYWQERNSFHAKEDMNKEKFYCLSMLPYPSGRLHMGHVRVYTISDVIARYQRMLGKNVLQPMGWDAFGLPAENAAISKGIPPAEWTYKNIDNMRAQMQRLGFAYDWNREFATCDPSYYRWEQWLFLRLYEKGLVYKKNSEVNWDPVDQTVLANEQVVDGCGWRSGAPVERRMIPQWFFRITAYADELLNDLDKLDGWPEQVKTMQRNWIGRSEGVDIEFEVPGHEPLSIFTTRQDTLYGVSFMAIAPTHPLTETLAKDNKKLQQFIDKCKNIKMAEADVATMEKLGEPLDIDAIHPLTGEKIPLWVANFVLMEYGQGALMGVPAHDQRDYEFATKYNLPIIEVIKPADGKTWDYTKNGAYCNEGTLIHSKQFNGMDSKQACTEIANYLEENNIGKRKINFRLRDWGVSRQRYWGTPIPIINCVECGAVPVPEQDLPVILPENVEFSGVTSPLKNMPEFLNVDCPQCKKPAQRETDTFDTFVESSWYYARYTCNTQDKSMLDGRANYWLPVDQYTGGIEHAVMHLLYARFFHKLMRDEKLVNSNEPFTNLLTQGMVLNQGAKMSKSKGNVVDPEELIHRYGADTVRLFMMFAAPPEQSLEWSDSGVEGAHRFLKRLWTFGYENKEIISRQNHLPKSNQLGTHNWEDADPDQTKVFREIYEVLEQAKRDYERKQFNTVVSGCMKILNLIGKIPAANPDKVDINDIIIHQGFNILLKLLAPVTPHITHQLWDNLDFQEALLDATWPKSGAIIFKIDTIELVVQVNGKLRSRISVAPDADQTTIENTARDDSKVQQALNGMAIKKMILVPGKLVNIVAARE